MPGSHFEGGEEIQIKRSCSAASATLNPSKPCSDWVLLVGGPTHALALRKGWIAQEQGMAPYEMENMRRASIESHREVHGAGENVDTRGGARSTPQSI